jgi:hypothetical protein
VVYYDGWCALPALTKILSIFPKFRPPGMACTVVEPHFGHFPLFMISSFLQTIEIDT